MAIFTVTNANSSGEGSLARAIQDAEISGVPGTIKFAASLSGQTITMTGREFIDFDLTIDGDVDGDGEGDVTIAGGVGSGIFAVTNGAAVELRNLSLTGSDTSVLTGSPGALVVHTAASLTIVNSSVFGNKANFGGAIFANGHGTSVRIVDSTFSENEAVSIDAAYPGRGGAIYIYNDAEIEIVNSTFVGNNASRDGGVIYGWEANVEIDQSTFTGNSAQAGVGGAIALAGNRTLSLGNSIVMGNKAPTSSEIEALDVAMDGANIIGLEVFRGGVNIADTTLAKVFALVGTLPNMGDTTSGMLTDNGGSVLTVALRRILDNPALDAADAGSLTLDARGMVRVDFPAIANGLGRADLGAFELQGFAPTASAIGAKAAREGVAFTANVAGVFRDDDIVAGFGDRLTYSLVQKPSWLAIDSTTGALSGTPGFASAGSSVVNVRATDLFGKIAEASFTLNVADTNRAPTGVTLSKASVKENLPSGTVVGTLAIVDPDGAAGATYKLVSNSGGLFTLAGNQLRLAAPLDFEKAARHAVSVEAVDKGGLTIRKTFTIAVEDVMETIPGTSKGETLGGGNGADLIRGFGGKDTLLGRSGDDRLEGGDGNDVLVGGPGRDMLVGGKGRDTASYQDARAGVTAHLARPELNTGDASGDRYESIEDMMGSRHADRLFGDKLANRVNGGEGDDVIQGGAGADTLRGGAGNDRLDGGDDKDVLTGGKGRDILSGGKSADTFVFEAVGDSTVAAKTRDLVADFSRKQKNRIDLSAIDANKGTKRDDAFDFVGGKAFTGEKGELRYEKTKKATFVYGDVNGDGKADFAIEFAQVIDLRKADFVL